jgi:hypothetical protein
MISLEAHKLDTIVKILGLILINSGLSWLSIPTNKLISSDSIKIFLRYYIGRRHVTFIHIEIEYFYLSLS